MANTVRDGESPARIITSGSYTYLLYPDFNNPALSDEKWAVKRIDATDSNNVLIQWADGNQYKDNAANDLTSLTFKDLV